MLLCSCLMVMNCWFCVLLFVGLVLFGLSSCVSSRVYCWMFLGVVGGVVDGCIVGFGVFVNIIWFVVVGVGDVVGQFGQGCIGGELIFYLDLIVGLQDWFCCCEDIGYFDYVIEYCFVDCWELCWELFFCCQCYFVLNCCCCFCYL